ncbi:hypothetical protein Tco_1095016 [Tanacetum coccineum]
MHIEKNALEALLNTLLQNDKSKDTIKARQDLETLRVRKELWLVKKPNGKFEKPHPKYSFTEENRKRFCKFIKGVRLPDGFGSNFKQKVTADDNNITGMKSHDCHIMMHRLLPYGVQRYLPKNIAEPIIELFAYSLSSFLHMKVMQDRIKADIIPFKTDQEILDEVVPSDNRKNMTGHGQEVTGGGSTSRRRTHRAYVEVINLDQMTPDIDATRAKRKSCTVASDERSNGLFASLKADQRTQRLMGREGGEEEEAKQTIG